MSEPMSMARLREMAGADKVGMTAFVSAMPGGREAVRRAAEVQQAELRLRAVVRAADLPAVMAEVERRAQVVVPVDPDPPTSVIEALMNRDRRGSRLGEHLGRLRALRWVYDDIVSGEWRP
ncbi:hypothetical protein [Mycobacterium sp.]|uniref:hypothetical protein n=1 Tax=Mycobacterium sp. TaxID=1785 RepID=UPI002C09D2D6|nr:hypothetical protein [Mycobacterium sp.]HTY35408.1 hypothetical protein [Mycobacterium sp.]